MQSPGIRFHKWHFYGFTHAIIETEERSILIKNSRSPDIGHPTHNKKQ